MRVSPQSGIQRAAVGEPARRASRSLVFDVGLHRGEDSAYYLARGFSVVGFEANPELIASCSRRFASEIERGQMTIVPGAIAEPGADRVTFYRNAKTVWGTTSKEWADRNAWRRRHSTQVTVPAVDFGQCLSRYGVPHYIKIDVEGADRLVLDTLCRLPDPPEYLSMESEKVDFDELVADIDVLHRAGYRRFKVVQQATIPGTSSNGFRFEEHASGPFGEELGGRWLSRDETIVRYLAIYRSYRWLGDNTLIGRRGRLVTRPLERLLGVGLPGWHDLHAAR